MSGGGKGGNVYDQSAAALSGAGGAYQSAEGMLNNPGLRGGVDRISSGIDRYMNPYTDEVINNSMLDMNRMTNMQQDQNAAGASAAGAFGGDRHGIVEAMTNSEAQRNFGNLAGGLRQSGFTTAAGLSGQDIANKMQWQGMKSQDEIARAGGLMNLGGAATQLGQTGYNIGNDLTDRQMGAGGLQQQLIQRIMQGAQGQYGQFMNQPQNLLNMNLQALGMNPLNQTGTTTGQYTPGLFDYLSLAGQTAGSAMSGGGGKGGATA